MKVGKTNLKLVLAFTITALTGLSGCSDEGSPLPPEPLFQPSPVPTTSPTPPGTIPGGEITPTPMPETSDDTAHREGNFPPLEFLVESVGYENEVTVEVRTREILKVAFKPGVQASPVEDTGFYAQYSALGVFIDIEGKERATPLLSNGFFPQFPAQQSPTMDYSNNFAHTCDSDDEACRETVKITVRKPNYDYWCMNYQMGCPWNRVYDTHPWNGTLIVETDDTDSID